MSIIAAIFQFVWPTLGETPTDESLDSDINEIKEASWEKDEQAFLDEARRLRDIETSRKNSADIKGQIYLAALLALIPILISLTEHSLFKEVLDFSGWQDFGAFALFMLAILYGIGAFANALKTLRVKVFHRVDVVDLARGAKENEPIEYLTKEILKSVRHDRSAVNQTVSFVLLTQKHIFRMAVLLLMVVFVAGLVPKLSDASVFIWNNICEASSEINSS